MTNPIESPDVALLQLLTAEQAHTLRALPCGRTGNTLHVYSDQTTDQAAAILEAVTGLQIAFHPIENEVFTRFVNTYYPAWSQQNGFRNQTAPAPERENDSDIVQFVDKVIAEAAAMQASDIHIERYEANARVRYRWEGQLIEKYQVAPEQYNAIISRVKILAELDISERRLPQDGRILFQQGSLSIDIRVSSLPGKFGEKVVLRLLTRNKEYLQLSHLGMMEGHLRMYQEAIGQPNGLILITGPTGSGKTTTLYASLNALNTPFKNILSVEDPIEYNLGGINQVQVREEIGLSFSRVLRAFLRQDPDIIMVGEIRDEQTADIAIRSALTGHLVLSTLHTNSAADAVLRLRDMGVPAYLLASSLRLLVAQRLIRLLCPHCKTPSDAPVSLGPDQVLERHFTARGCVHCHFTGYRQRRAIYEMIPISAAAAALIRQDHFDSKAFRPETTLQDEAFRLVQTGETSWEEAMTVAVMG